MKVPLRSGTPRLYHAMIYYANTPLLLEDQNGELSAFLGEHLSLEDLRLFGDATVPKAGNRNNSQGASSHLISLPTPNYPAPPKLRINTLYWPTGAARWSFFLGLATDSQLYDIRSILESRRRSEVGAAQLVIGDASVVATTIPADGYYADGYYTDPGRLVALSTEMWMLTPRCISGANWSTGLPPDKPERIWLLPLVDERYFWQTKRAPDFLYANVHVEEEGSPSLNSRTYKITFVGRYSKQTMPAGSGTPLVGGAIAVNGTELTGSTGTSAVSREAPGSFAANEVWLLTVYGTGGTFTLDVTIPSQLLLVGMPATTTTDPLPWDASPEEVANAIHDTLAGRVRWESLFQNLAQAIDRKIDFQVPADEWGYPDRTELDRPHENVAMILDAVAHSTGRRVVRDISGGISLLTAYASDQAYDLQTSDTTGEFLLVAGQETLSDRGWNQGQYVPESINVVFRDLTRSTRHGTWSPPSGGGALRNDWHTAGGRLIVNVPVETANLGDFSDLVNTNEWAFKVRGWIETIHTPTFNGKGTIGVGDEGYTKLAGFIAADWYDWRRRLFDHRFVGIMPWLMTGYDDHVEFTIGERRRDGSYIAGTRIQSMPMNFGCSELLNQIGTQCGWTEDFFMGELRESLAPAGHPRLDASKARAWMFLPAMELQGEEKGLLPTHKRAITVALRSVDADAEPNTFFEAHKFFCEKNVVWLDCDPYCNSENGSPSVGAACSDDPTCEVIAGECMDNGTMNLDGDSSGS